MEGTKGLYEVRIEVIKNIYRIFAFFDHGKLYLNPHLRITFLIALIKKTITAKHKN